MAYDRGNQYCEIIKTAQIDVYNVRHIATKNYEQCYQYHNNTKICDKSTQLKCRYAVGSLSLAIQKLGIVLDLKNNKPSIAYANACFLPNNHKTYGNHTQIQDFPRMKREVTLAVVALISVLGGALVARIIQIQ